MTLVLVFAKTINFENWTIIKDFTKIFMNKQKMKRITKEPITWLIIF